MYSLSEGVPMLLAATYLLELINALFRAIVTYFAMVALGIVIFVIVAVVQFRFDILSEPRNPDIFRVIGTVLSWFYCIVSVVVAVMPHLLSITVPFIPGVGPKWTARQLYADTLVHAEREAFKRARSIVLSRAPKGTPKPGYVYVLRERQDVDVFAIGNSIFITQATFDTPFLAPLVAHALGHIVSNDSKIAQRLRFLIIPTLREDAEYWAELTPHIPLSTESWITGAIAIVNLLFGGGIGMWLLRKRWEMFWLRSVYRADRFVFACYLDNELKEYFQQYKFLNKTNLPIPYYVRPHIERRIDYLDELKEIYKDMERHVV